MLPFPAYNDSGNWQPNNKLNYNRLYHSTVEYNYYQKGSHATQQHGWDFCTNVRNAQNYICSSL